MNRIKSIVFISLFITAGLSAAAQDLHFSQYFNSPLTTNPANTGFIPDADYRLGVNYRDQWSSVIDKPYRTISVWGDAQLFRDRLENGWLGVGGVILSDVAGAGSLRSDEVYGSVAYHQMLGLSSLLSAGFNLGYASKRVDPSNLKFPDQFNGKFFDGSISPGVQFTTTKAAYFDMQAGLNYAWFPQENVYVNVGYSIHHINKPTQSFFGDDTENGKIPMRQIGFLNAMLKVDPRVIINPNIYFTTQAKAVELEGGINANYNLSEYGEQQLIFGLYYRNNDAIIPMAGIEAKNVSFTFSYDATVSGIRSFNGYRGAAEFSIVKKGFYPNGGDRKTMCPSF